LNLSTVVDLFAPCIAIHSFKFTYPGNATFDGSTSRLPRGKTSGPNIKIGWRKT